ncbi:hypothetical protein [Streptomyces sp. NPDC057939]|uniref:hypothetical protein n=1 Tax=Streptomyces sp. NPDC057939 TaxID=3346284 RepID=UPI0036EB762A
MTHSTRTSNLSDLGFRPVPVAATQRPALLCQPCARVSFVRRAPGTADVKGDGRS